MLKLGNVRTCWNCKYSGKFSFPGFFLGLMIVTVGLFVLVAAFLITNWNYLLHDTGSYRGFGRRGNYFFSPLIDTISAVLFFGYGIVWFIRNRSRFFMCPQCHMPEANSDPK